MNKFCLGLFIFALMASGNLLAADANGKFAMKGAGMLPCNLFTNERASQSDAYYLMGGWVEGYISAHNKFLPDTFDVTTFESLELLLKIVDTHCQSHPQDLLHGVVDGMIVKLAAKKISQDGPKLMIADGEKTTYLYQSTLLNVQQRLADLGLYKGSIDGMYTDATQAALIAFQSDIRFEPTGFPDQATLWRLLRH